MNSSKSACCCNPSVPCLTVWKPADIDPFLESSSLERPSAPAPPPRSLSPPGVGTAPSCGVYRASSYQGVRSRPGGVGARNGTDAPACRPRGPGLHPQCGWSRDRPPPWAPVGASTSGSRRVKPGSSLTPRGLHLSPEGSPTTGTLSGPGATCEPRKRRSTSLVLSPRRPQAPFHGCSSQDD